MDRGDEITHEIIDRLNRTFVVPLDRDDTFALAKQLDDVVDWIDASSARMALYRIPHTTSEVREMAHIIVSQCEAVVEAIGNLRRLERIGGALREINRLENMADRTLRDAVAGLLPVLLLVLAAEFVNGKGIVVWSTLAWFHGLPTSESHALVAALAGAGMATAGASVLLSDGWRKILIGLGFSSVLGFVGGLVLLLAVSWLFRRVPLGAVRRIFGRLQVLSAAFMAFSHGSNDGQKFIGVFTLTLVL